MSPTHSTDFATPPPLLRALHRQLVVSCQADEGSPFDAPPFIAAFAECALRAGAAGLRLRELANVVACRAITDLPIIGLTKRAMPGSPVYITPTPAEVTALAQAGANIVAFDATLRPRPYSVAALVAAAQAAGALAMADCATLADAEAAVATGADIIATTMSGYTDASPQLGGPDFALMRAASALGRPVFAEGRINSPSQAQAALDCGVWAVVVGSAITRPEVIAGWFVAAVKAQRQQLEQHQQHEQLEQLKSEQQ
jgi:N-acylglucosamine-6-phosphate 2-epimerase